MEAATLERPARIAGGGVATVWTGPVSVAHQHLFQLIWTLLDNGTVARPAGVLRLLDVGCGDGRLMANLAGLFARHLPHLAVEVHGFDVGEQGYRDDRQQAATIDLLRGQHPGIDWSSRVRRFGAGQAWDYPAGHFHVIVSNQVLEHVDDMPAMLRNLRHALAPDGASLHLFPLESCIEEAHCHVPFAHWIRDFDQRVAWLSLTSRLGIGRFRRDQALFGYADRRAYALETAKFIQCWTSYRSFETIADACYAESLAVSYQFTKDFFLGKLRRLTGDRKVRPYRRWPPPIEWMSFMAGRVLSSTTVIIRPVSHDVGARIAAEKAAALH